MSNVTLHPIRQRDVASNSRRQLGVLIKLGIPKVHISYGLCFDRDLIRQLGVLGNVVIIK